MAIRRIALVILFLCATEVSARPQVVVGGGALTSGTPFHVVATQDGNAVIGYRLYLDGAINQDLPKATAWANGIVSFFMMNGVTKGKHTFIISAYNNSSSGTFQESKSAPLNINLKH